MSGCHLIIPHPLAHHLTHLPASSLLCGTKHQAFHLSIMMMRRRMPPPIMETLLEGIHCLNVALVGLFTIVCCQCVFVPAVCVFPQPERCNCVCVHVCVCVCVCVRAPTPKLLALLCEDQSPCCYFLLFPCSQRAEEGWQTGGGRRERSRTNKKKKKKGRQMSDVKMRRREEREG